MTGTRSPLGSPSAARKPARVCGAMCRMSCRIPGWHCEDKWHWAHGCQGVRTVEEGQSFVRFLHIAVLVGCAEHVTSATGLRVDGLSPRVLQICSVEYLLE
eukprot:8796973-Pyramimonas_sp.AAC.1